MPGRTVLCLLALAASLCAPVAVVAQADTTEPLSALGNATAALPGAAFLNASLADVQQGLPEVSLQAQAAARLSLRTAPSDPAGPASPHNAAVATPPSPGARVATVAAPVAGSAILTLSLAALAFGLEGLRALQARASGQLGRFGRALAGLLPVLPLFSRIERGALLDNPVRVRVHDAVAQEPGLSLSGVRLRTGIAWGTAVHHLRRLEDHGLVVSVSQLAHRRYFAANTPAALQRTAVTVVIHPTARRIAHLVSQRPGIGQTGICQALGLNNPAASKHLRQFETQGLVLSRREGNSRVYHPTGALHSALLLLEPAPAALAAQPSVLVGQSTAGAW